MKRQRPILRMRGLSLVEMMVALTIGLLVLAAVSTVFVNSRVNYTTQESLARLQENARFALHFLQRDLRMAGYYGCAGELDSIHSALEGGGTGPYNFNNPIEAFVGGALYPSGDTLSFPTDGTAVASKHADCPGKTKSHCAGTAALVVRMADPATAATLRKTMPNTAAAAFLDPDHPFDINDVIMLTDCAGADIFQITNLQTASDGSSTVVHNAGEGTPGNSDQRLSRIYKEDETEAMQFVHRVYYIGTGASGHPSLFRMGVDGSDAEELVEGIENLEVRFGVDTAGDRTPRTYLPADDAGLGSNANQWKNVVSARITLTARPTLDPTVSATDPNTVKAKPFGATVLLRNLK